MVRLLLNNGAEVNAQGESYGSAFQAAMFGRQKSVMDLLIEYGASTNAQGGPDEDARYGDTIESASQSKSYEKSRMISFVEEHDDPVEKLSIVNRAADQEQHKPALAIETSTKSGTGTDAIAKEAQGQCLTAPGQATNPQREHRSRGTGDSYQGYRRVQRKPRRDTRPAIISRCSQIPFGFASTA